MKKLRKFKCVKSTNIAKVDFKRVPENIAKVLVIGSEWSYTSKSAYKRFIKDGTPKFPAGEYGSSSKKFRKAHAHVNSTKRAGEQYQVIKTTVLKDCPPLILHTSLLYESNPDPILGGTTISKQGQGVEVYNSTDSEYTKIFGPMQFTRTFYKTIKHIR